MSKTGFPIGIALGSAFVSVIILSWQTGVAFVDLEPDESEIGATTVLYILIGYLIYLLRHFVVNEGRKYTISAFSISVILATVGAITYDQQVGGWFWNDDWVMEEALIASIRPVIILLLLNEFFGVAERGVNNVMNAGQDYVTSLVRIGIIGLFTACCDHSPTCARFVITHRDTNHLLYPLLGIDRYSIQTR